MEGQLHKAEEMPVLGVSEETLLGCARGSAAPGMWDRVQRDSLGGCWEQSRVNTGPGQGLGAGLFP